MLNGIPANFTVISDTYIRVTVPFGAAIEKEVKTREVGYFVSNEAGVPHPDISLCRALSESKVQQKE